jgi:hypothetical protein
MVKRGTFDKFQTRYPNGASLANVTMTNFIDHIVINIIQKGLKSTTNEKNCMCWSKGT